MKFNQVINLFVTCRERSHPWVLICLRTLTESPVINCNVSSLVRFSSNLGWQGRSHDSSGRLTHYFWPSSVLGGAHWLTSMFWTCNRSRSFIVRGNGKGTGSETGVGEWSPGDVLRTSNTTGVKPGGPRDRDGQIPLLEGELDVRRLVLEGCLGSSLCRGHLW